MNKRRVGADKERQAAEYLTGKGMQVLETNFRCRQGEIDLICRHRGYLVFVEVKYRSAAEKGYALEAVDHRKQRRICRVADYYRYARGLGDEDTCSPIAPLPDAAIPSTICGATFSFKVDATAASTSLRMLCPVCC